MFTFILDKRKELCYNDFFCMWNEHIIIDSLSSDKGKCFVLLLLLLLLIESLYHI